MKTSEKLISALLTILLGVLFIVMKSGVISVAMTVFGVVLIILGVLDLVDKRVVPAVVKLVVGVLIIVFGWTITAAVLYIFAALLLIYGILMLYSYIKSGVRKTKLIHTIFAYVKPILLIVIGILLFCSLGRTLDWIFIVSGIIAVVEGAIMLVEAFKKN